MEEERAGSGGGERAGSSGGREGREWWRKRGQGVVEEERQGVSRVRYSEGGWQSHTLYMKAFHGKWATVLSL